MNTKEVIPLLKAIQAVNGWTNYRLAKELGVAESLIRQLYNGNRGIGITFLGRIGKRFPTLQRELWAALISPDEDDEPIRWGA